MQVWGNTPGSSRLVGVEAIAVDNQGLGAYIELVYGPVHGQKAGMQDIDFIDFIGSHHANGPAQSLALDLLAQGHAPVR